MYGDDVLLVALRDALNHLYDPDRLRKSLLIDAFGLSDSPQPTVRLQQTLLDAIHAMKPAPSEPVASIRRRIYSVLQLRYEQQFAQKEVAAQLGLGVRQYRRLQQNALQALEISHHGIVLETGKVKLQGPAQDLLNSDEIRKAYLGE